MFTISPGDVLKALKRCKRLAKQDLLASELTSDPEFWREHAQARRATYDALMALVESEGVDAAHRYAMQESAALPLADSEEDTAATKGKRQALEMFFCIIGAQGAGAGGNAAADERVPLEASS
ncbi:MAG: hypothetical protein FWJ73_03820 [Limnochordales bacterium]|jgi:hypothetical protein|nr:hypothetical protein [Bacillota bacterium]